MPEFTTVFPKTLEVFMDTLCEAAPFLKGHFAEDVESLTSRITASCHLQSAWQSSSLSYNGEPVEFTVTSLSDEVLACTIDPFVKSPGEDLSLKNFFTHSKNLISTNNSALTEKIEKCQALQKLKFGSWAGLKYSPKGKKVKVYSETPEIPEFDFVNFDQTDGLELLMAGYYPDEPKSSVELYYQWHSAEISLKDILRFGQSFKCENLVVPIIDILNNLNPLKNGKYPETTYGVSATVDQSGNVENFSLFFMTNSFFGGNRNTGNILQTKLRELNLFPGILEKLRDKDLDIQFNVLGISSDIKGRTGVNCTFSPQMEGFSEKKISLSVTKSSAENPEKILKKYQLESGAFASNVRRPGNVNTIDENAFVTAQVLRIVEDKSETRPYIEKALDFLENCRTKGCSYSFWPQKKHPEWLGDYRISADVDDTSVINEVLYRYGRISQQELAEAVVEINSFQVNKINKKETPWGECSTYHTWMHDRNHISQFDCCVNTNALTLLQLAGKQNSPMYNSILKMLSQALEWSRNEYSRVMKLIPYYAHPYEWLDALKYACESGVKDLSSSVEMLQSKWSLPQSPTATPLYCRHDGLFIWSSPCLSELRQTLK